MKLQGILCTILIPLLSGCTTGGTTPSDAQQSARDESPRQAAEPDGLILGNIPVYPGAKPEVSDDRRTATMSTNDDWQQVHDFYLRELPKQKWTVDREGSRTGDGKAAVIASDGTKDVLVHVRRYDSPSGTGSTGISVSLMPRGKAHQFLDCDLQEDVAGRHQ